MVSFTTPAAAPFAPEDGAEDLEPVDPVAPARDGRPCPPPPPPPPRPRPPPRLDPATPMSVERAEVQGPSAARRPSHSAFGARPLFLLVEARQRLVPARQDLEQFVE